MNYAVYAARQAHANERDARFVELDASGNPTNTYPNGQPFSIDVINAAREIASFDAYSGTMVFLDAHFGDDNDTTTRKRFDLAKAKIEDRAHAERLTEKLMTAALNGSQAAIVCYAAVSLYLNPYAPVDFSWYTNGSDELTAPITAEDGYPVQTGAAGQTVSATISVPAPGQISDFEGFATTYHVAAPTIPAPTSNPITIRSEGRVLTQTVTGWQAESKSNPGTFHHTSSCGSTCSCPGHTYRAKCWHTALVRAHVAHERDTALPAPRPRIKTRSGIRSRMWK